jgi:hypothetical protein
VKYALLVYDDDSAWIDLPAEERNALRAEDVPRWHALFEELGRADPNVIGKELSGRGSAKVVRVRDGARIVTDGPFAETKEILGGLVLVDLPDLDEAIRLAALLPAAEQTGASRSARSWNSESVPGSIEGVFREEWGRAVAILTRVLGNLELAEDAV